MVPQESPWSLHNFWMGSCGAPLGLPQWDWGAEWGCSPLLCLSLWNTPFHPSSSVFVSCVCLYLLDCCSVAQLCPTLRPHGLQHTRPSAFTISQSLLKLLSIELLMLQPSRPLSSPSPPAFNLSQHGGLFQWVGLSHQVAKLLVLQLQHQSLKWIFRVDFF